MTNILIFPQIVKCNPYIVQAQRSHNTPFSYLVRWITKKCVYAYTCFTALAYRCATRHSAGEGAKCKKIFFLKNYLNNSEYFFGKTTLPIQIFSGQIFIFGDILFSLEQICVGKFFDLYFRGKFSSCGNFFLCGKS